YTQATLHNLAQEGGIVPWCLFFFSSRRRHTRFSRDWSSDVCSSDLRVRLRSRTAASGDSRSCQPHHRRLAHASLARAFERGLDEIGRASCRERVWISVVVDALQKIIQ